MDLSPLSTVRQAGRLSYRNTITSMIATLRRGRTLRLPASEVLLQCGQPHKLATAAEYVYLSAAHSHRVELQPPLRLVELARDGQYRHAAPWQLNKLTKQGWRTRPLPEALDAAERVLVIRNMGLGDVLMLTPALQALHRQWQVQVEVATYARYVPLLWGLPGIAAAHALGTDYQAERFDVTIDLNWAVESGEETQKLPRQDIFARLLHVRLNQRRPIYRVADSERHWARQQSAQWHAQMVGIQVHASCRQRTYPANRIRSLTELLQAEGYTVAFLGEHWADSMPPQVVDLTGNLSLRQAAALIEQMAAMICPDSGLLHLAVAVGTPTVGLFGPIPPQLRTAGYPHCQTVTAVAACPHQPCFDSGAAGCRDPYCMQAIEPQSVVEAMHTVLASGR